jgi:hypothetical protein
MLLTLLLFGCEDAARDTASGKDSGTDTGVDTGADSAEDTGADTGGDSACEQVWFFDDDGDGYGLEAATVSACEQPAGYAGEAGDCNDTDATVNPAASETCDGEDEDCDGAIDEEALDATTWLADKDGDGFGAETSGTIAACEQPEAYTDPAGEPDCDDDNAAIHPGAEERCDAVDRDCDGVADNDPSDGLTWYADADGDGAGDAGVTTVACTAPAGFVSNGNDCDDTVSTVFPGADEHCNDIDDDCDGTADEAPVDPATWYRDRDGDGYGDASTTTTDCDAPAGYAALAGDCEDSDATVNPGRTSAAAGATRTATARSTSRPPSTPRSGTPTPTATVTATPVCSRTRARGRPTSWPTRPTATTPTPSPTPPAPRCAAGATRTATARWMRPPPATPWTTTTTSTATVTATPPPSSTAASPPAP